MSEKKTLIEAYKEANYKILGHGARDVQTLQKAFSEVDGNLESDIYGTGQIIEDFQEKMANILGKEASVFLPSGTMAQQIALRIWCDEKGIKKVAYHPLCHLEIHEEDGLKKLHQIEPILLADKDRLITLEDVTNIQEDISCLLLELPQREIGGQLPKYSMLEKISTFCSERNIKLHLDGARLFEILPYYEKTAAEVCSLFDSVYISLYKGIGGIAGAILAGDKEFIKKSKVWKRRHGGDLISLYPYIISSDYYFNQRINKMEDYYKEAGELAKLFNSCYAIKTKPELPVSNMFHVHFSFPKEKVEQILKKVYIETGVGLAPYLREVNEKECYYEVSIGDMYSKVPKDVLEKSFSVLDKHLQQASEK